jgi:hypothetical protein
MNTSTKEIDAYFNMLKVIIEKHYIHKEVLKEILDKEINDRTFNTECQVKGYQKLKDKLGLT